MKHLFSMLLLAMLCLVGSIEVKAADYYVAGDGNGSWCDGKSWDAAGSMMTDNGDGTYSITFKDVAADIHQFKVTDGTWSNSWGYDNVADKSNVENGGGNVKFNCAAGDVTINFVESTKSISVSFVKGGEVVITSWTIAGVAAITGNAWAPADANNDMTDNGDGTWTLVKENLELAAASYEYKVVANHAWGVSDYPESGNYNLNIAEAGTYTVTFSWTPSTSTLSANAQKTGAADVELVYYIKNGWNGGGWTWQLMTQEGSVCTYTGVFGGTGVNINSSASDNGSKWFDLEHISGTIEAGDYAKFTYNPEANTVSAVKVVETVTINPIGDASYVCTNALDFTDTGVTAYVATEEKSDAIVLAEVTQVPAGTAFVVKGEAGEHIIPAIGSATLDKTNLFQGSATESYTVTAGPTVYAISKTYGDFRPVGVGVTIPAGKAYIVSTLGGAAKSLVFGDDDAAGITNVNADDVNAPVYNIAGQRVNANVKGIVIKNGKKYIVK